MFRKLLIFFVITKIQSTESYAGFVIPNHELKYSYKATITAGLSSDNDRHISQSNLTGNLHLQHDVNSTIVFFTDLKHSLYNGVDDGNAANSINLDLPKATDVILKPFRIVYSNNGLIDYLHMEDDEKQFSRNIKKAIASSLQVNLKCIQEKKYKEWESFQEKGIYDNINVEYKIESTDNDVVILKKKQHIRMKYSWFRHFYYAFINDFDLESFDMESDGFTLNNTYDYKIKTMDGEYYIDYLMVDGGSFLLSDQNLRKHFIVSKQVLTLESISKEMERRELNSFEQIDIVIDLNDKRKKHRTHLDLGYERQYIFYDELFNITYNILCDIDELINENPLSERNDFRKSQAGYRLFNIMTKYDLPSFEYIYNIIEVAYPGHLKYYIKMIPIVGTKESRLFIKKLITDEIVNKKTLIELIKDIKKNIETPSLEILDDMNFLLEIKDPDLLNTGVLTYASLIQRVFRRKTNDKNLNTYIQYYMNKIKNTEDNFIQNLYINGLNNIKFGVSKALEPIVKGEVFYNHRSQHYAIMASMDDNRSSRNEINYFDLYWNIMTNETNHLEIRCAAYLMINTMTNATANITDYMKIQSEEFYNFFYTDLKTKLDRSFYDSSIVNAAENILSNIRKPYGSPLSGNYFINLKLLPSLHLYLKTYIISTETSKFVYFTFVTKFRYTMNFNTHQFYIRIEHKPTDEPIGIINEFNVDKLLELILNDNIYTELTIIESGHVIGMYHGSNIIETLFDYLIPVESFLKSTENKESVYTILDAFPAQMTFPSNLGYPITLQMNELSVGNILFNILGTKLTQIEAQLKIKLSRSIVYDLNFYNYISNVFQGVRHVKYFDYTLPLHFKANTLLTNDSDSIQFNIERETNNEIGFRTYQESKSYVFSYNRNDYTILQKSNNKSLNWMNIGDKINFLVISTNVKNITKGYEEVLKQEITIVPSLKPTAVIFKCSLFPENAFDTIELSYNDKLEFFPDHRNTRLKQLTAKAYIKTEKNNSSDIYRADIQLNMNKRHDDNSLNITIMKMGVDDYKYYDLTAFKKWVPEYNYVLGYLKITDGENELLKIDMKGETAEQNDSVNENCKYTFHKNYTSILERKCIEKLTSIRGYTYNITMKSFIKNIFDDYVGFSGSENKSISVNYPLEGKKFTMVIDDPMYSTEKHLKLTMVPGFSLLGLYPDNFVYNSKYVFYSYLNLINNIIIERHLNVSENNYNHNVKLNIVINKLEECMEFNIKTVNNWCEVNYPSYNITHFAYLPEWNVYIDFNNDYMRISSFPFQKYIDKIIDTIVVK